MPCIEEIMEHLQSSYDPLDTVRVKKITKDPPSLFFICKWKVGQLVQKLCCRVFLLFICAMNNNDVTC